MVPFSSARPSPSLISYLAAPYQADGAVPGRVERHQSVESGLVRRAGEAERRLRQLVRHQVQAVARLGRDGRQADGVLLQPDQLPHDARVVGPKLGRGKNLQ